MTATPLPDKPEITDRERLLVGACEQYEKALDDAADDNWASAAAHRFEARARVKLAEAARG